MSIDDYTTEYYKRLYEKAIRLAKEGVEIWRSIDGYEGIYEVSNLGRVKSLKRVMMIFNPRYGKEVRRTIRERILRIRYSVKGNLYGLVTIHDQDGRQDSPMIHRLVLNTFAGRCPLGLEACHNDGNRYNNKIDNLRWDTHSNNCQDRETHGTSGKGKHYNLGDNHPQVKFSGEIALKVRELWDTKQFSKAELSRKFGMAWSTVDGIIRRCIWSHI